MTALKSLVGLAAAFFLVSGCSVLPKPEPESTNLYLLEYKPARPGGQETPKDAPVVMVTVPRAYGGYDTPRIAYMQEDYSLRYYTRSRWADTPGRMLAPLLASALQATGQFQALYTTPGSVSADMRLETELIRLYQDFRTHPSEVRITLRAQFIDLTNGRVIATWMVDRSAVAGSDDAYGGVVAANRLVGEVLDELAQFCLSSRP
jgi:cholesterol transport system auxiliary component